MMSAAGVLQSPSALVTATQTGPLETKWFEMSETALYREIERYRRAIEVFKKRLDGEEEEEDSQDDLGVEGVDYRLGNIEDIDPKEWQVPPYCIPIHANVTSYNWLNLSKHCQFDVIMMDPPWQLATANPTRGVSLGYSQLTDKDIQDLPIPKLQTNGFLFIWVINAKYQFTMDLFERWGYTLVDEIVWVKMTVNRRLAKSHGFYLQHAKEVCLVAMKGDVPQGTKKGVGSDIIYSERRGQSQKPEEIYHLIEQLVPNGRYLEIFGRKNNLRNFWVTVGNEVTGHGLPKHDQTQYQQRDVGAVFGDKDVEMN